MRTFPWFAALSLLTFLPPAAGQGTGRFSQFGVSFDYPKEWKVTTAARYGVSVVTLKSASGIEVNLHLHPSGTNPIGARIQLERELQQAHEGKLIEPTDEVPRFKFSVGEQEGMALGVK